MEVRLTPQEPARHIVKRIIKAEEIIIKNGKSTLNLFKVDDHFETYGSNAVTISEITGVRLEERFKIAMIAFPLKSADIYFPKIVRKGYKLCVHENI